jgi:hypothetical protein
MPLSRLTRATTRPLIAFVALAYALTWGAGIVAALLLRSGATSDATAELIFTAGAFGPVLAALAVAARLGRGRLASCSPLRALARLTAVVRSRARPALVAAGAAPVRSGRPGRRASCPRLSCATFPSP